MGNIISDFQFIRSQVETFDFKRDKIFVENGELEVEYNVDYDMLDVSDMKDNFFGLLGYRINLNAFENDNHVYELNISINGIFKANHDSMDIEEFEKMLEFNGLFTMSQITRTIIMSSSSMFGLDKTIILPMIDIYKLVERKHENTDDIISEEDASKY